MRDDAIKILGEKLKKEHVSQRKQGGRNLDYIESHHAIREANRAFGFDGWNYEIEELKMVSEEKNNNDNHVIGYFAIVTVAVNGIIREDVGFGSGISKNLADAHEGATKEAVSDAMKRALRTFGDIFGLALYDKKQEHVEKEPQRNWINEIRAARQEFELQHIFKEAWENTTGKERDEIKKEYDKRKSEITELGGSSQAQRGD
ncbi:RAD52 family DNA repair protein [Candidatus Pacearchaeota archaeon]|nr:RAD52 family DNA repair protein [Candidatus Pacearchaeota archaeon]